MVPEARGLVLNELVRCGESEEGKREWCSRLKTEVAVS